MTQPYRDDPEAIPSAWYIRKGFIRTYASGTHTGDVQLVGSHPTLLEDIRFATDIPAAECDVGRECLVIFLNPIDQTDALVLAVQGAVPGAPGGGDTTFIAHTDTPGSYSGQGLKLVRVNTGATGLEFVTAAAYDSHAPVGALYPGALSTGIKAPQVPYYGSGFTATKLYCRVAVVPAGAAITVQLKRGVGEGASSNLGTAASIAIGDHASTAGVLNQAIASGDYFEINITQVGSSPNVGSDLAWMVAP